MKDLDLYGWLALTLMMIGGIDLGLYGLFGFNLVQVILGDLFGRLMFIVVGVSAGYFAYMLYQTKFKKI